MSRDIFAGGEGEGGLHHDDTYDRAMMVAAALMNFSCLSELSLWGSLIFPRLLFVEEEEGQGMVSFPLRWSVEEAGVRFS